MKILMYSNRKVDPLFWDITTQEDEGFLALFRHLDEDWQCYNYSDDDAPELDIPQEIANSTDLDRVAQRQKLTQAHERELSTFKSERALYEKAKNNDGKAAKRLLTIRQGYEYEEWSTHYTEKAER